MEGYSEELVKEIQQLLDQRLQFKQQAKWEQADEIQRKLWETPYHVKVIDNNSNKDGICCDWMPRIFESDNQKEPPKMFWETMEYGQHPTIRRQYYKPTSFVIGTVDSPLYRDRYKDTFAHLEKWQTTCSYCCCQTTRNSCCAPLLIQKCHLIDLQEYPSIGVKKILFEGWRQKLLPQLRNQYSNLLDDDDVTSTDPPQIFVFVAEDDIRFPDHVCPCQLVSLCDSVFKSHPDLDILSLGHSWWALCSKEKKVGEQQSLLEVLQSAKGGIAGVHASTLMAIRVPQGIQILEESFDVAASKKKQSHLDSFLFYSPYHTIQIALCDPPLAGWAEVETTLTKSPSGHRRRGGGRRGSLPSTTTTRSKAIIEHVSWVRRRCKHEGSITETSKIKIT